MKVLLYFVDGFAWNYISDGTSSFTSDDWICARPLDTVLGYSSSIVPVLISGKSPAVNGVWTEYYRDDHRSPLGLVASHVGGLATPLNMGRLVAFRIARKAGWQSAHKLRIPLELAHHFRRHPIDYKRMPQCELAVPTIADICAARDLRMSFSFISNENESERAIETVRENYRDCDVFFFYDCTVDHAGHNRGPVQTELRPELDRVAKTLDKVRGFSSTKGGLEVLVFSDHGMTTVSRAFDVFETLKPLRIGRDFLAFPDSTFVRFWYPSDSAREMVRDALKGAPGSFLTEAEADLYGVPYPDERYGQDVLLADEGVVFHPSYISPTFFRTAFPDKGMHGYRPEFSSTDGVVLYSGKALQEPFPDRVPASGVFDLICGILAAVAK